MPFCLWHRTAKLTRILIPFSPIAAFDQTSFVGFGKSTAQKPTRPICPLKAMYGVHTTNSDPILKSPWALWKTSSIIICLQSLYIFCLFSESAVMEIEILAERERESICILKEFWSHWNFSHGYLKKAEWPRSVNCWIQSSHWDLAEKALRNSFLEVLSLLLLRCPFVQASIHLLLGSQVITGNFFLCLPCSKHKHLCNQHQPSCHPKKKYPQISYKENDWLQWE